MTHFKRIGGFSSAEAEFFLGDMQERATNGRYFCSRTYYSILRVATSMNAVAVERS